ncbi:carbohydrate esterase [Pseudoneurospora amorphoporcata]|uniref:Carbohydrate esterase n=1 Tax=Pseudoneurospora amorphoporcata TaxID=241081 RepID=A0AAN6NKX1_9PEZI|nr:carbohydrate esterase [Pseudoneurospora amorphoporcata]
MPLGASITAGYGTNPQNGYRKPLRDQLRWRGWPVNMVGSLTDGDPVKFHNRQHEGHKGYVVDQMTKVADNTIYRQPNVVLINCGTNDADTSTNHQVVASTGERMRGVLNHLFDKIGNVTIVLSTLLPRKDGYNDNVNSINTQYRALFQEFAAAGRKIVLAEFNDGFLDLQTDYFDNIHPNERGAAKLAAVWDQAILKAETQGFLSKPTDTGIPDDGSAAGTTGSTTCDVVRGAGLRGPVKAQQGFGADDGTYNHADGSPKFLDTGTVVFPAPINSATGSFAFAQLVNVNNVDPGGERDELVWCTDTGPGQVPGPCFMLLNVAGAFSQTSGLLKFDPGLECLAREIRWGDVNGDGLDDFICINLPGNMYVALNRGGNPPRFEAAANGGLIRVAEPWCAQDRVRLGDMDGDGRLDYCCIDLSGDIYCWRNGGVGDTPTEADGGYWQGLPTFYAQNESEGVDGVRLVDINGDHRSDWVYVYKDGSTKIFINQRGTFDEDGKGLRPHWVRATTEHPAVEHVTTPKQVMFGRVEGTFDEYPNHGSGGTKRKGDGVFYCDMFGRGHDDYLWVLSTGEITLFENVQSPPNWGQHGVIIDRHTGRVEWWRNKYKQGDKSPTFEDPRWAVDTGSSSYLCIEGWGWDYLCMEKDARTVAHLNKATGLIYKDQIKFAPVERLDRANFKWADVTGDGLVDLLWVDKFAAGARGIRFDGHGRGQNIHFPKLGNFSRADYHDVYPGTGLANTWFNECSASMAGEGEDDYPTPVDPMLPTPPGEGTGPSIWDYAPDFSNDPFLPPGINVLSLSLVTTSLVTRPTVDKRWHARGDVR